MIVFFSIDLPEQQPSATAAARDSHQRPIAQPFQTPDNAPGDPFGNLLTFDRTRFQIEQQDQRLMNRPQRIAGLM